MSAIRHEEILARLAALEQERGIRILLAVESGSRAWGFPSIDSDFDVRFLYAHPVRRYLSVEPLADTIEPTAIMDGLDIGGWDIRKALWLLCRSNATPLEWASSPIRYREGDALAAGLARLGEQVVCRDALAWHYRQTARRAWAKLGEGAGPVPVPLKPLCYALRTALAVAWLDHAPTLPPMSLQALLAGEWVGGDVRQAAQALVALKAAGDEAAVGPCHPALASLIRARLAVMQPRPAPIRPDAQAVAAADRLLHTVLA